MTFEQVKVRAEKRVPCPRCRRYVKRQTTITHTVNPFNVDKDTGLPKTREQVRESARAEASAWEKRPEVCRSCQSNKRPPA